MDVMITEIYDENQDFDDNLLPETTSLSILNDYKFLKVKFENHNKSLELLTSKILKLSLFKCPKTNVKKNRKTAGARKTENMLFVLKKLLLINLRSSQIMQQLYQENFNLQKLIDKVCQDTEKQTQKFLKLKQDVDYFDEETFNARRNSSLEYIELNAPNSSSSCESKKCFQLDYENNYEVNDWKTTSVPADDCWFFSETPAPVIRDENELKHMNNIVSFLECYKHILCNLDVEALSARSTQNNQLLNISDLWYKSSEYSNNIEINAFFNVTEQSRIVDFEKNEAIPSKPAVEILTANNKFYCDEQSEIRDLGPELPNDGPRDCEKEIAKIATVEGLIESVITSDRENEILDLESHKLKNIDGKKENEDAAIVNDPVETTEINDAETKLLDLESPEEVKIATDDNAKNDPEIEMFDVESAKDTNENNIGNDAEMEVLDLQSIKMNNISNHNVNEIIIDSNDCDNVKTLILLWKRFKFKRAKINYNDNFITNTGYNTSTTEKPTTEPIVNDLEEKPDEYCDADSEIKIDQTPTGRMKKLKYCRYRINRRQPSIMWELLLQKVWKKIKKLKHASELFDRKTVGVGDSPVKGIDEQLQVNIEIPIKPIIKSNIDRKKVDFVKNKAKLDKLPKKNQSSKSISSNQRSKQNSNYQFKRTLKCLQEAITIASSTSTSIKMQKPKAKNSKTDHMGVVKEIPEPRSYLSECKTKKYVNIQMPDMNKAHRIMLKSKPYRGIDIKYLKISDH